MKKRAMSARIAVRFLLPLAGILAGTAQSADPGHPCAVTPDPAKRLACYDTAFPPPPTVREATAAQAIQEFGLATPPPPLRNPGQPEREADPDRIDARVAEVVHGSGGRRTVVLENGQRWTVQAGTIGPMSPGDTVQLRKGALGAYLLRTQAGVSLRARRVR
ncbi:hypothetical protein [Luteimonas terrae]|uniref:Type IV pilus biogenesis protein PilP n=1 Tax=Luteimonas terrae TaxID=1530191 RepID=A0ABU1Y152_9GAMM|nr:hypothetical protein [Luteimonas terrae]MDR7194737.1 hypothetical protein [Luteimonas terrae]